MSGTIGRAAAATGIAIFSALTIAAIPAEAGVTLYDGGSYTGRSYWFAQCDDDENFSDNRFGDGTSINDKISSYRNYGSVSFRLYEHSWGGGASVGVSGYGKGNLPSWFNNRASSLHWNGC